MYRVKENVEINKETYLLTVKYPGICKMGQFFMLRCWEFEPLLSRPISIFDCHNGDLKFLYQVIGRGTKELSKLRTGDEIALQGPFGNGFPYFKDEKINLVGGGMGIAPLFYAARELYQINPNREVNIYLGFREESPLIDTFIASYPKVTVDIGGFITDKIIYEKNTIIYSCGPEAMMKKVYEDGKKKDVIVYQSIERRMACGVGACLGCNIRTTEGNKRVCKDGPVFLGDEIIYE